MSNGFLLEEEKEVSRRLKWQTFWVERRELFKKIGYGLFIAFDAALLLFVAWTFLDSFVISAPVERQGVEDMVSNGQADLNAYTRAVAAEELVTGRISVLASGEGEYDFYTTLSNPNDDWWAEVTYLFRTGDGETESQTTFILPSEEKPLVAFGYEATVAPRTATVDLTDVRFHRVDHHLTGEYATWAEDRLALTVENPTFTVETLEEEIGRVTFTVSNDTAYSYYDPVFYILLERGSQVVSVNRTTLTDLETGESEEVVVNWFGDVPSVSRVTVIPEVNIFDLDVYKALEGESPTDTRTRVFPNRRR